MIIRWYDKYKQQKLEKEIRRLEWALSILKPQHEKICGINCYYSSSNYYAVGDYIVKKYGEEIFLGGKINEQVDYIKLIKNIHKEAVFKLRQEKYSTAILKVEEQ